MTCTSPEDPDVRTDGVGDLAAGAEGVPGYVAPEHPDEIDRPRIRFRRPPGASVPGRGVRRAGHAVDAELVARLGPYALVAGVVVAVNALLAFGVFDGNPLLSMSGLAVTAKGGILAGRFTIDPAAGTTSQSLGHLAALDVLHGKIPWWNPYEGVGAPLAGEMQSAALFPLTVLLALPDGQLPFHMLLEAVAGLATYRLLARLGVSRWIAAGAGCAFAVNGTFAWFTHAPVNPIAFLPLLLLGLERARAAAEGDRGGSFGVVAVALALSVYAGFPEVAYLDGIFAVVWAVVRARRLGREALLRYARKVGAGVLVGALLAAPILVAFGDYLPAAYLGPHGGGYNALSVPGAGVGALFFPYAAGPIFGFSPAEASGVLGSFWINVGGYLTTALLVLAVVGLWSRRLRTLRIGLAAWIVTGLGRTYGVGPLQRLFDVLPIMNNVEVYRYITPSIELAFVVLAFLAVDDVRRRDVPPWFAAAAVVAAAGVALLTLEGGRRLLRSVVTASQSHDWLVWSLVCGFGVVAVVAAAGILLRGRLRAAVLVGLVVLDSCAMFVVPELSAPQHGQIDTALVRWAKTHTRTDRLFTLGGLLNPNYGTYFEVAEADVNDIPMPGTYARFIQHRLDRTTIPNRFDGTTIVNAAVTGVTPGTPETPVQALSENLKVYESIGVRYVVTYTGSADAADVSSLGYKLVYADIHAEVFRLPRPAPLYSVRSLDGSIDPTAGGQPSRGGGRAGATRREGCRLSHEHIDSVTVDCRRPAILVRRELAMAGWSAEAGGRPLAVHRHGYLFEWVQLRRGRTVVRFSFVPPHEDAALWGLLIGLVALPAGWGFARRDVSLRAVGRTVRRRLRAPD
jgi:hypothetical protein